MTIGERFWCKVDRRARDECWPWKACRDPNGYGRFSVKNRSRLATRIAWELTNGPIPDGLFVCHSCDNPSCCNPAHLWLGTHTDNMHDMLSKQRCWQQKKTHCPHGHAYTPENTKWGKSTIGGRQRLCRECQRQYSRERQRRVREERRARRVAAMMAALPEQAVVA